MRRNLEGIDLDGMLRPDIGEEDEAQVKLVRRQIWGAVRLFAHSLPPDG